MSKEYIENIKKTYTSSNKEFVLHSLTGLVDRVQKTFPRYGSFLMEFIQNADDAKSESLKFEILEDTIRVYNDGEPFSIQDVESICKAGQSAKTPESYIGYLGVGFKSVFLISEHTEIYSGNFRFRFSKRDWDDPDHMPWQIIPIWIDSPQIAMPEKYKTVFNIQPKEADLLDMIRKEVKAEHLSNRILLFLRNIERVKIIDSTRNFSRKISISSNLSKTSEYEIYQTEEYKPMNTLVAYDRWLVFRSLCTVPQEVKDDYVTKEWERDNIDKREVSVAFKLGSEDNITVEPKGTAHIGVFSFLPLKEIPSGLNFLIQADFLTTPGRGELARDSLWNNWLADEICCLITDKIVPAFLKHEKWKMNITEVLYSSEGGHELFEYHIKNPLRQYLEDQPVLIAEDGSLLRSEELVDVKEEIRELLTDEDMQILSPNKKIIHRDCMSHLNSHSHRALYSKIEKIPSEIHWFLMSPTSDKLIQHKAASADTAWFKKIYSILVDKYDLNYFREDPDRYYQYNVEHDKFWDRMRNLNNPIVLTEDFDLAKINECYTNPRKLRIPQHISGKFKIVHHELARDAKFEVLLRKLNEERYHTKPPDGKLFRALTEDDIRDALRKQEALEMDAEKWNNLSDEGKVEEIKHISDLWSENDMPLEDYDFLTLKSMAGNWTKPGELIFPNEYRPEHNIETLFEKGLLDLPVTLLSPIFIGDQDNEGEIKKWYSFFRKLGVDEILEREKENPEKNRIVERIAILTALQYEKENGRIPVELGESEQPGYDVRSESEKEIRYIEVKGRAQSTCDIFLTANEFRALYNKAKEYFAYVVIDVLRNPTLYVVPGEKMLQIDPKVIISSSKWRNEAMDKFQPLATNSM